MRIIIFGAGAVGSVIGGRVAQSGANVVLVGRPAHVEAINANGLLLRTGEGEERVSIAAVASLDALAPHSDDVVIITAKTQDTPSMHAALRSWNSKVAVVCGTNGIEHERMALRNFSDVYGMVIQLPATFALPGEVTALCMPTNALIDVGCYPTGINATTIELAHVLSSAPHILCEPDADIMVKKSNKILMNLGNAAEAACGLSGRGAEVVRIAQEEAKLVYQTAGIRFEQTDKAAADLYRERAATMNFSIPAGQTFLGGSTWQSLAKGSTSLETDYFNGEIVLLGRIHNVPTPANQFLQDTAFSLLQNSAKPGSLTPEELETAWQSFRAAQI
jgi:2-dehydropantoate 2-reductase